MARVKLIDAFAARFTINCDADNFGLGNYRYY